MIDKVGKLWDWLIKGLGGNCQRIMPWKLNEARTRKACPSDLGTEGHTYKPDESKTMTSALTTNPHSTSRFPPAPPEPFTPLICFCTWFLKSPITFPAGQYSHTTSHPLAPSFSELSQSTLPQPTLFVFFQTSWVKCPVGMLKPVGLSKLYILRSSPQASITAVVLA